jgi:abhydrolase domain-containing protein 13
MNPNVKVKGIILENTFTCISDMVDSIMPVASIFKKLVQHIFFPSIDRIKYIEKPILFVRGLKDEIVPAEQSKRL